MEYLSTDKILIVDLAKSEAEEEEVEESLVSSKIGGAGITKYLYEKYQDDDPIVIGTGLLTGTTYPASATSVMTAKSPVTGKTCHCPIIFKVGVEIKYSGYDYIVVKGAANSPVYLWIHDGVADIMDASDIWGKDVWESTDYLRGLAGDDLLQTMLIGKAGENQLNQAQVCYNHWSSPDRFGIGKIFGSKNLKGFAFRGMGLLDAADPESFLSRSLEILKDIKKNDFISKKGVGELGDAIGDHDLSEWLAPIVHRHSADYFTPYATITGLFMDEDPNRVEETKVKEPGVLVTDISALSSCKKLGLSAENAGRFLKACAKYGIDPLAVTTLSGKNSLDELQGAFDGLTGTLEYEGNAVFSPWAPLKPIFNDFGLSDDHDEVKSWWERRQAVALIFGIQPLFILMSPEITEENLLELANIGTDLDIGIEALNEVISYVSEPA
ncbi:MAG: aldehyde ferredoxin oxidoreductase N-terminal domain-containing protein [Desulfatiglandales bacterium]